MISATRGEWSRRWNSWNQHCGTETIAIFTLGLPVGTFSSQDPGNERADWHFVGSSKKTSRLFYFWKLELRMLRSKILFWQCPPRKLGMKSVPAVTDSVCFLCHFTRRNGISARSYCDFEFGSVLVFAIWLRLFEMFLPAPNLICMILRRENAQSASKL